MERGIEEQIDDGLFAEHMFGYVALMKPERTDFWLRGSHGPKWGDARSQEPTSNGT